MDAVETLDSGWDDVADRPDDDPVIEILEIVELAEDDPRHPLFRPAVPRPAPGRPRLQP